MKYQDRTDPQPGLPKFIRVVGTIWLAVVLALLIGAMVTPHLGRMTDVVLHLTSHRAWVRMQLQTNEPFFDLSTPIQSVKSYYSALYRGDAAHMERLTEEPLRQHMRQRLSQSDVSPTVSVYHSYLHTEQQSAKDAVVVEKFHLFWKRGLRFYLQRHATDWRIQRRALLP
jgi:hypothetical protein